MYGEVRSYPISKIDRGVASDAVLMMVQDEESKLPATIDLTWPEGQEIQEGQVSQAGISIGQSVKYLSIYRSSSGQRLLCCQHASVLYSSGVKSW